MDSNTFISDQFNAWANCQKRYYYKYLKKLSWPEIGADFKLGTSIHKLMDYYLRGLKIDHLLENLPDDIQSHWNSVKNHPILKHKVIGTEWIFNTRIGNSKYWLNGRIDAIFYDKEKNKYIIADWKTNKDITKLDKSFQHKIYLYSFFNSYKYTVKNLDPANLVFMYIKTADNSGIIKTYSEEKNKEYEETFFKIISEIENFDEYSLAADTNFCKFCQYKQLCSR